ncbi:MULTISPECIES: hypothetical protein [unclassified Modestobacter]|uniref:hypothetical protein n=1 Tax=unclassified Modestobacter TaxID=2643866 RepID=UPI0022AA7897|nr:MULTISPECIES: hypothetical protein [unclassified Modestobacter]MCZ2825625.1 hypothetical protein [Modestobacter sp. VKM Ac-2981]MCZ2853310.1 hypothetical protein [Modestobacter sp. VKM Ac-2982]
MTGVPTPRDGSVTRQQPELPAPRQVLEGERVLRVNWLPGSDRLRGLCHCGAEAEASDPVEMWEWLLAHPDHPADGPTEPPATGPLPVPPAHLVTDPLTITRRTPVPA